MGDLEIANPEYIATTEDGLITWIAREGCTRRAARLSVAEDQGEPVSRYKTDEDHLRPLKPGDCPAHPANDFIGSEAWERDDMPDECCCYEVAEGEWTECEADHPDAIPCWRVEAA